MSEVNTNIIPNQHPFVLATYGNQTYRILTRQYLQHTVVLYYWTLFFVSILITVLGVLIVSVIDSPTPSSSIISGLACIGFLLLSAYCIYNRSSISLNIVLSTLFLSIYLILVFVVSATNTNYYTFAILIYSVAQMILQIVLIGNKSHIVLKALVMLQILLISLKADHRIQTQWNVVFYIVAAACIVTFTIAAFILVYLVLSSAFYSTQQSRYHTFGIILVFLIMSAISLCLFIPVSNLMIQMPAWKVSIGSSLALAISCCHMMINKSHIIVFLSQVQESNPLNQSISCVKVQHPHILSKKYNRVSQNWCVEQHQSIAGSQEVIQQPKDQLPIANCLICLQKVAEIIWINCGHISTCATCYQHMLEKKNINCILCKQIPQHILKVRNSSTSHYQVIEAYSIKLY